MNRNPYPVNLGTPAPAAHLGNADLVSVRDLSVNFRLGRTHQSQVLKQVTFTIARGEIVALLGESGSGKTTIALSLLQMLPPNAYIAMGSIRIDGRSLLGLNEDELCRLRGSEISAIYQDSDVLNPVMRVGNQVIEVLRAHKPAKTAEMRDDVYSAFAATGLNDCDRIYRAFPHQLSGGERRRVAIAQAVICKPRLVIADEPTSSLDAGSSSEILAIFQQLREMYNTSFLLITHDPETLAVADRILVMYAGEIVESGPLEQVFEQPSHPYTSALLQCRLGRSAVQNFVTRPRLLSYIPGQAPDPTEILPGCSFSPRCSCRMEICDFRRPELFEISPVRSVRCFQYEEAGS
jgi:peptide/nickel transport system ATP-binding protein